MACLHSSDSQDNSKCVQQVRISDKGSRQQYVLVQLHGVPARGVIDSGADITIIGGELFKRVAATVRLRKSQLRKSDKVPKTYDQKTFSFDG